MISLFLYFFSLYIWCIINNNIDQVKYMYIHFNMVNHVHTSNSLFTQNYPSQVFLVLTPNILFVLFLIERFVLSHLYRVDTCSVRFFQQIHFILVYGLWCLTPLSTIFQLYRDGWFQWWWKPVYPEKTIDLSEITD